MVGLEQLPEITNEKDRIVRGWGSVEIKDKDGEVIPMKEFSKIMPIIMKRGGAIMDAHSNKQRGKILNYEFAEHPETKKEAVRLLYQIYDDYPQDTRVWEDIKAGKKGLSFGGASHKQAPVIIDMETFKDTARALLALEGYEFSIVDNPSNPEAWNTQANLVAKGDTEIKKPFAGYSDFAECVSEQKSKGKSEESANKICGFLQARTEKGDMEQFIEKAERYDEVKKELFFSKVLELVKEIDKKTRWSNVSDTQFRRLRERGLRIRQK